MTYISLVYFYKPFHISLNIFESFESFLTFLSITVINITTKSNLGRRRFIHFKTFWSQSNTEGGQGREGRNSR